MNDKAPEAFRTISEVSSILETPPHVLRFWETKFAQLRPVKRAGGRRYYRPSDVLLLGGIKRLLHDDGMTIRGVQKLLRTQGVRHVSGLAPARALQAVGADEEPAEVAPAADAGAAAGEARPAGNGGAAGSRAVPPDPDQPDLFGAMDTAAAAPLLPEAADESAEAEGLEDGRRLATVLRAIDPPLPEAHVEALRGLRARIAALHGRMTEAADAGPA